MYANSNFRSTEGEAIKVGDEVTQAQIGATDEEWQEYQDRGVVTENKPPDIPSDVAPAQFYTELAAKVAGGEASREEITALREAVIPQLAPGEPLASVLPAEEEGKSATTPAKPAATPAKS